MTLLLLETGIAMLVFSFLSANAGCCGTFGGSLSEDAPVVAAVAVQTVRGETGMRCWAHRGGWPSWGSFS